ncbi:hypothetical protein RHGRI_033809 [Rhododendron griersonianum]|uniref:GAG-pre-integrase domain-containing protein n=1 Tax=Rhododendron griersonianum TaxID=479676 RepID=A0AAV6HY70_9ERIC|nr:hypothetical protein RHGRI_033809 [Rhododendron griersonianum]
MWRLVEVGAEIGKVVDKPLLGYKKVSVEEGCFISPKSILRFQVERGEFPHCLSSYRNYVVPPTVFATWADDILGNADFVELLRKVDVHRAVMNSLRLDLLWRMWAACSGCLCWGKVDPSSGRLSPSQQGVVDALRRSVRREKGHGGVKNTFTKWARYWYKDLGASKAGEEAHVVTNGPGLKEPAHLAAFLAYWLTWYIFPGPPKDGVDTTLFELTAILASGESVPLAQLFLGTLFKRLDMRHDAAQRSCGRYDLPIYVATNFLHMFLFEWFPRVTVEPNNFGADDSGGKGEPCQNVCRSARWSGSGVRDVRGNIADVIDVEEEFVARPYVNTPKGDGELCLPKVKDPALALFGARSPYVKEEVLGRVKEHLKNIYGTLEKDLGSGVSLSDRDGEGRAEGVRLSGKRTSKRHAKDVVEVAKPSKRKKLSKGEVNAIGDEASTELWHKRLGHMSEKGMQILARKALLPEYPVNLDPIPPPMVHDDYGGDVQNDDDVEDTLAAEETEQEVQQEQVLSESPVEEQLRRSTRERQPLRRYPVDEYVMLTDCVVEEVVKTPRVEVPETKTGGGSEVPSNSLEAIGTLDQHVAAHGGMDDIWGDEGVSSGRVSHPWKGSEESSKVIQSDVVEEVVKTPQVEVSKTAAGGGLESEKEEEEDMEGEEEEEERSEDNDRGDEQRDEEEGEENDCDDD